MQNFNILLKRVDVAVFCIVNFILERISTLFVLGL